MYIAIDGIDGCGKTTISNFLVNKLTEEKYKVCTTKEPGGTYVGEIIRDLLINKKYDLETKTELLLYSADRYEHQKKVIIPALKRGEIVVSDRFASSTYAYQVRGRKLDNFFFEVVNRHSIIVYPDILFILDADIKTALNRANARLQSTDKIDSEGKFESLGEEFFQDVRAGFIEYAEKNIEDDKSKIKWIKIIDVNNKSLDEIQNIVYDYVYYYMFLLKNEYKIMSDDYRIREFDDSIENTITINRLPLRG